MDARLYLILTPQICRTDPVAVVRAALAGGVDCVQLRDKEATDAEFVRLARAIAAVTGDVPLILNDRAHLVLEAGADGVHLGEGDGSPADVAPGPPDLPNLIVGLSTHSRAEVAAAHGVTYLGLGPMFATRTKALTRTPRGAALVREVAGATTLPVFPIGGIDATNAPELIAAGATRLAVSSAICAAEDPRAVAAELRGLL